MKMHPSGMTWERWESPWKNEAERRLVILFYKRQKRTEKQDQLKQLGPALL